MYNESQILVTTRGFELWTFACLIVTPKFATLQQEELI